MEIKSKISQKSYWWFVEIIQTELVSIKSYGFLGTNTTQSILETSIITFTESFETVHDAEQFTKSKQFKAVLKAVKETSK